MKSFIVALLGIITFSFVSCGDPIPPSKEKIVTKKLPVIITEADLFTSNKILSFLNNEIKFLQEANSLFLSGVDAYRNKKELDSAAYYFRQSLLKEPTSKSYYELGNLYMTTNKLDDALLSYNMAEQLNYEPFSKILYNKACIYSIQDKRELSSQYIEYAIQAGYSNFDHIEKDTDLDNVRDSYYFKKAMKKGLRGVSNAENLYWIQFKKQFSRIAVPYELEVNIEYNALEEEYGQISYEYEKYVAEMRDEAFSREVSKLFYYHSIPYETENIVAVIYIIKDDFMGEYSPLTYRLATFTHDGKLIDKKVIGGRENLDSHLMVPYLNLNQTINIAQFTLEYEKDPNEYGYYNNPIVSKEEFEGLNLKISEDGKIEEISFSELDIVQNQE